MSFIEMEQTIACQQREIDDLRARLKEAQADAAHWKNNHETEVRRARILKERTDMPIERVDAYEQWGKDQVALKEAQEAAEFNFQQYQDAGRLLCEAQAEIEKLKAYYAQVFKDGERQIQIHKENAAASQAREVQLREALENHSGNYKLSKDECKYINSLLAANPDTTALEALIAKAVKESNDRLHEERELWDRKFADGAKKLERLELELDDCLYVLEALWDKQCNKIVTQQWADILIRNKRDTGASSAEDTYHPTTE